MMKYLVHGKIKINFSYLKRLDVILLDTPVILYLSGNFV